MRVFFSMILVIAVFIAILAADNRHPIRQDPMIRDYVTEQFHHDTAARNAVTAILLNYRMYDTLFEALILLTAIVGMHQFLPRAADMVDDETSTAQAVPAIAESTILKMTIGLLYPFMMLFGFYIIYNGLNTPGGGFQGGSILAALLVARYVVHPIEDIDSERLHRIERIFFALILLTPMILLFPGTLHSMPFGRTLYLRTMDILIGIEVGFGLSVAILRFAFFKGRGITWHL